MVGLHRAHAYHSLYVHERYIRIVFITIYIDEFVDLRSMLIILGGEEPPSQRKSSYKKYFYSTKGRGWGLGLGQGVAEVETIIIKPLGIKYNFLDL